MHFGTYGKYMKISFKTWVPMLETGDMLLAAAFSTFLSSKNIGKFIVFIIWHPEFGNLGFR